MACVWGQFERIVRCIFMAELILTDKEKEAKTYIEWSNDSLGKLVKTIGLLIKDEYGKESAWMTMAAHLLVDLSRKTNSTDTTVTVSGCTNDGEKIGDWAINIKRLDTPNAGVEPPTKQTRNGYNERRKRK